MPFSRNAFTLALYHDAICAKQSAQDFVDLCEVRNRFVAKNSQKQFDANQTGVELKLFEIQLEHLKYENRQHLATSLRQAVDGAIEDEIFWLASKYEVLVLAVSWPAIAFKRPMLIPPETFIHGGVGLFSDDGAQLGIPLTEPESTGWFLADEIRLIDARTAKSIADELDYPFPYPIRKKKPSAKTNQALCLALFETALNNDAIDLTSTLKKAANAVHELLISSPNFKKPISLNTVEKYIGPAFADRKASQASKYRK